MTRQIATLVALVMLAAAPTQAHHSFSTYDIDNKIERTGVLKRISFSNPHIRLELEVERDDGSREFWHIESMNPRRWDRAGKPRDLAAVGETVTILGWPARDGSDTMVLSTIVTERGRTVIIEDVRQRRARENLPAVTVRRE